MFVTRQTAILLARCSIYAKTHMAWWFPETSHQRNGPLQCCKQYLALMPCKMLRWSSEVRIDPPTLDPMCKSKWVFSVHLNCGVCGWKWWINEARHCPNKKQPSLNLTAFSSPNIGAVPASSKILSKECEASNARIISLWRGWAKSSIRLATAARTGTKSLMTAARPLKFGKIDLDPWIINNDKNVYRWGGFRRWYSSTMSFHKLPKF